MADVLDRVGAVRGGARDRRRRRRVPDGPGPVGDPRRPRPRRRRRCAASCTRPARTGSPGSRRRWRRPRPVPADTCAVTAPDGRGGRAGVRRRSGRRSIAEVAAAARRIEPDEVLQITRGWDGRPVWIARGNGSAGLQHLLRPERILAFLDKGVAPADIPGLALRAVAQGPPIGRPPSRRTWRRTRRCGGRARSPAFVYAVGHRQRPADQHRRSEGAERVRRHRLSVQRRSVEPL